MRAVPHRLPSLGRLASVSVALTVSCVCLAPGDASGAGAPKIRWVTSIYVDGNGGGLRRPEGVACGADFFVVADTGNSRLLRYGYGDGVAMAEAEFPLQRAAPTVVQVNSKGDVYFLDTLKQSVEILSATGEKLGEVKPRGLPSKTKIVPKSFKIDRGDDIYVLDIFSERVLVLDPEGGYRRHIRFPEDHGFFADLAVDPLGAVLLLDGTKAVIYTADPKAEVFSPLGESLKEYMNYPTSLATDDSGTLYLLDQFGSGLAVVSRDGSFMGRPLGMGWTESRLFYPSQVCIGPDGILAIADRSNSRVQIFSLAEK